MNWTVLIIFGVIALSLLIFLIVRNQKDEKIFEEEANQDYHKSKDEEGDAEIDKVTK
jgi:FtsZ-interacting cell division protein ZipA